MITKIAIVSRKTNVPRAMTSLAAVSVVGRRTANAKGYVVRQSIGVRSQLESILILLRSSRTRITNGKTAIAFSWTQKTISLTHKGILIRSLISQRWEAI